MTVEEQREAYLAGVARARAARARGGQHLVGWQMELSEEQANGYSAVAEALVADAVGGNWISDGLVPDARDAGDVEAFGRRYAVRWTPRPDGRLILREKDPDGHTAVLVVGIPPEQKIVGCTLTGDAKLPEFWRDDAWFVPQAFLRPLST